MAPTNESADTVPDTVSDAAPEPVLCAVCGDALTTHELAWMRQDIDFMWHGDRGHLIYVTDWKGQL